MFLYKLFTLIQQSLNLYKFSTFVDLKSAFVFQILSYYGLFKQRVFVDCVLFSDSIDKCYPKLSQHNLNSNECRSNTALTKKKYIYIYIYIYTHTLYMLYVLYIIYVCMCVCVFFFHNMTNYHLIRHREISSY